MWSNYMSHVEIPMYLHLVFVILKLNLTFFPISNYLVWNSDNIVDLKLVILRLQHAEISSSN